MIPMKARMSRSWRLGSGRTTVAATSRERVAAASAMDRAPGVDPDPLSRQAKRYGALLRDPQPADEIDRKIGAEEHTLQGVAGQVGAEERAEERERVHPRPQGVRLTPGPGGVLDHDVLRADRQRHLGAGGEAVRLAGELDPAEPYHAVMYHGAGDEVHQPDEVGDERGRRLAVDLERWADLLDHPVVHHHDAHRHRERLLLLVRDHD